MTSTRFVIYWLFLSALIVSFFDVENFLSKKQEQNENIEPHNDDMNKALLSIVDDKNKQFFILHIGPTKTGSTSIQCGLSEYSKHLAEEDGYYYIGKDPISCRHVHPSALVLASQRTVNSETGMDRSIYNNSIHSSMANNQIPLKGKDTIRDLIDGKILSKLEERLREHHSQGHHVIFSAEEFESYPFVLSILAPLQKEWNVKIVITYRRYYEWLVSTYNQNKKMGMNRWPTKSRRKASNLVEFLSKHTLSLNEARDVLENNNPIAKTKKHQWNTQDKFTNLQNLYHTSKELFSDVTIFNFHNNGNLIENFLCNVLPSAKKTCHLNKNKNNMYDSKNNSQPSFVQMNPSISLDASFLTDAAYHNGFLNKTLCKKDVMESVGLRLNQIENRNKDEYSNKLDTHVHAYEGTNLNASLSPSLPLICLSGKDQHNLLQLSLVMEQHWLSEWYETSEGGEMHSQMFYMRSKENNMFCEIDKERILEDEDWIQFFRNMKHNSRKCCTTFYSCD